MRINNSQTNYFNNDVIIYGGLSALSGTSFTNTVFTTTSALSVVNTGVGPALYVSQAAGSYDVASFYDGDGVEVLHVGNAAGGGNPKGKIGINESNPGAELTVNGAISSNYGITAAGGNSNQWNSNWTTTNTNSANWTQAYTNFNTTSASYFPLFIPLSSFNIGTGFNSSSTIIYALSGFVPSSDVSPRLAKGRGTFGLRFMMACASSGNNKKLRFEMSSDNLTWTNIVDTSDNTHVSMTTYRDGVVALNPTQNAIIFQAANQSSPDGSKSTAANVLYPYLAGDAIYWRCGISLAQGTTETYALCAGYIRISPY